MFAQWEIPTGARNFSVARRCSVEESFPSSGRRRSSLPASFILAPRRASLVKVQQKPLTTSQLADPTVAVIGCGYVGLHLMEVFSKQIPVIGYDISPERLAAIRPNFDSYPDTTLTFNKQKLSAATHFLISVPTLLRADKTIDTSYIEAAIKTVSEVARPGSVVVVESSVAVGMTRKLLQKLVTEKKILGGMSPERVDPGRISPAAEEVPKIVSGLDEMALEEVAKLYARGFDTLVKVSSCEAAEMVKLYENCQRMINIAYANEMADAAMSIGLDPYEVARAAATKPYGYMPFTPGMGIGGHCIPVNPSYLLSNLSFPLLKHATDITASRPASIARSIIKDSKISNPRALIVGIGFKAGQSVLSNSTGLACARECKSLGCDAQWYDPLVSQDAVIDIEKFEAWSVESIERDFDIVIVGVQQHGVDFKVLRAVEKRGSTKVHWRIDSSRC